MAKHSVVAAKAATARARTYPDARDAMLVQRCGCSAGRTPYLYYDVSASEWRNVMRSKSAGRAVNRILNQHLYGPES